MRQQGLVFPPELEQPEVTFQLNFPKELEMAELRNQAARDLQRQKYPSSQELGMGGKGVEGAKPVSDFLKPIVATAHPMLLTTNPKEFAEPTKKAYSTAVKDLWGAATFVPRAAWSPVQTGKSILGADESGDQMRQEVGKAWQQGDYPYALRQGFLNMLPMGSGVGRMVDESAVDPAQGVGHAGAAATLTAFPKIATAPAKAFMSPVKTLKAGASAVKTGYRGARNQALDFANRGTEPHMQYFKAIRPKNQPMGAAEAIKGAEAEINRGAEILGLKDLDLFKMDEALAAAKTERIAQARALRGPGQPFQFDATPVADSITRGIPRDVVIRHPEVAKAITEWVDETYRGKKFGIEDVDALRKGGNRRDAGFWNKLPAGRMNQSVNQIINKLETDALRKLEYDGLEQVAGTGKGAQQVNRAIRDILKTEEYLDRRYNVELRQAIQNLPQQVGKLAALGQFGKAAKALMKGDMVGAGIDALTGMGEIGLSNFLKELNSTNGQIASAFRRSQAKQAPIPVGSPAISNANRALPPAGARATVQPQSATGAASPGSTSAQSQWQRPTAVANPQKFQVRDPKTGRVIPSQPYAGEVPKTQNPVTRGATGRMGIAWREAVKKFESENPGDKSGSFQMRQKFGESGKLNEAYTIDRDPMTGRFKKVILDQAERLKRWNQEKGQKGAVKVTKFPEGSGVKPSKSMKSGENYFVDDSGEIHHVDSMHVEALSWIDKKVEKEFNRYLNTEEPVSQEAFVNAMKKNGLARVSMIPSRYGEAAIDIQHTPSLKLYEKLLDTIGDKKKVTWDLNGEGGGGTGQEFMIALDKAFPSKAKKK